MIVSLVIVVRVSRIVIAIVVGRMDVASVLLITWSLSSHLVVMTLEYAL
jgi:hypothetical protein